MAGRTTVYNNITSEEKLAKVMMNASIKYLKNIKV